MPSGALAIYKDGLPLLMASLLLTSCSHYAPLPLARIDSSALLSPPVEGVLSQQAQAIDRPYLNPVAVDLSVALTPNEIAILAVLSNPDLRAMRKRAGVADAQSFAAGLLPDPSFSFGVDHILSGPDPVDNISGALGFSINALRTQAVLRDHAKQQALQVRLDLAWAEWQISGNARLQAVRIVNLQEALAIATASEQSAQSLLTRYLAASGRGDIPPGQVQSARLSALDATASRKAVQTGLVTATYELRRLLGLPPGYKLVLALQTQVQPSLSSSKLFKIATVRRTDLEALRTGYRAQEAAVHKAVLDQFPALDLTITGTRDTGRNKLLGPSIGLALPLWNRNRGGIAIERATREALQTEYDARLFQTRADIAAAVAGLNLARQQQAKLLKEMPEIESFAIATRRAATRGDLSLATAETAEQALRDRQLQLVQVRQAIDEQMIALELLVGAPQESWAGL